VQIGDKIGETIGYFGEW